MTKNNDMAKQKTLQDFPSYVAAYETMKKVEAEHARVRNRLPEIERQLMAIREGQLSALASFQAESSPATVDRESLRREYGELEKRQDFLAKALSEAKRELDRAVGFASLEICNEARPAFLKIVEKKLAAKKADAEANRELRRKRDELIAQDIITGSIPGCIDNAEERYTMYERFIRESFPELG